MISTNNGGLAIVESMGTGDDTPALIEIYEERAAIHEYEAGLSRMQAESMALRAISEKYGTVAARKIKAYRESGK